MQIKGDLPSQQKDDRHCQKAPGVCSSYKKYRGEDHGIVPVIDAACAAALAFKKPALKGTEKQDADHVAHGIGAADQDHDAVIKNSGQVQGSEDGIEADPDQGDQHGGVIVMDHDVRFTGAYIVAGKLLLAAGTFQSGREKTQDHLQGKNKPQDCQNRGLLFQNIRDPAAGCNSASDVKNQNCQQEC